MTTCPYCQHAIERVAVTDGGDADSDAARYVLCPGCHNLVAGAITH